MRDFYNLGDLIDHACDLDTCALIDLGGERPPRQVTYRALDALANGVANALVQRGLARGERIAILSANRTEFLAAYYGIMRAGGVAVPVNFKFPHTTIAYVLRDSDARLVFCDALRSKDVPAGLPVVEFGSDAADGFDAFLVRQPFAPVRPQPDETAMFLYTSGSTGRPKGVILSHDSHLWVAQTRVGGKDWSAQRLLVAAPLYHMNALALATFASVAHATVVLLPQFNARAYLEAIAHYRCTWLTGVPPMLAMMLREKDLLARTDLSSVQYVRMGSAPVSQSLLDQLHVYLPQAAITNVYGTTEAGPVVFGPHPQGLPQPGLSAGTPHPAVRLRLIDTSGSEADEGELEMQCPALMSGYHKLPEATARALTADGYYRTGDIFRRDGHGFHYFVGRVDDMFVSGGENIYPSEVEQILEQHPAIEQACVIPLADEIKGMKPVAFVVLKPGTTATEDDIKQYALANAPAYQHPRHVWCVAELPLAGTNKIDRKSLAERAQRDVVRA
jgi:acyl-CoA synthetase (AMP-forming)/AMP-acid ligase II